MSEHKQLESIAQNPQFRRMVKRRQRMVWRLSIAVLAFNLIYILVMSYAPAQFARPVHDGTYITNGIIYYLLIIALGVGTSAYYSWWSNRYFDPIKQALLDSLQAPGAGSDDE